MGVLDADLFDRPTDSYITSDGSVVGLSLLKFCKTPYPNEAP